MNKDDEILRYKTSMSVFKKWAVEGLLNGEELLSIDTKMAAKYGLSLSSIFRESDLLCTRNRANIGNDTDI